MRNCVGAPDSGPRPTGIHTGRIGPRLIESASALAGLDGVSAVQVFGSVDAQKLRSSMTLFARAAPDQQVFRDVLAQYFGGEPDEATISRL